MIFSSRYIMICVPKRPKAKTCFPSPTSILQKSWKSICGNAYLFLCPKLYILHTKFWTISSKYFSGSPIFLNKSFAACLLNFMLCNKSIEVDFIGKCIRDNIHLIPRPPLSMSLDLTMILDYSAGLSLIHHIIVSDFHTQTYKQTNRCSYVRNIWYCIMNEYLFLLSI